MLTAYICFFAGIVAAMRLPDITPSPTTEAWAAATFPVPHPYGTPSTYQESLGSSGCLAHLKVRSTLSCFARTVWESTTSVTVGVDCNGCSALSVSVLRGGCPLGGGPRTLSQTTVTATPYTHFDFSCAPTPAPSPGAASAASIRTTDITKALAMPTLSAGQSPSYTPTALSAVYWPDGACYADLELAPTAKDQAGKECAIARSTTYTSTVTSTIGFDCGGCQVVNTFGDVHSCPEMAASPSDSKVTAAVPATRWDYHCK
ncbi:hypothetical protein GQ53DRAFT_818956 [Thozetella sp. PMI_491]|nr:hypothetical protein GQ53DRAFT_818956 [Thozetella sp. PMI_491]